MATIKDHVSSFITSYGIPVDFLIDGKWCPCIADNEEYYKRYKITALEAPQFYYLSFESLVDYNDYNNYIIAPGGTHALTAWKNFDLSSSSICRISSCSTSWNVEWIRKLIIEINPWKLIMAGILEKNVCFIKSLWLNFESDLYKDRFMTFTQYSYRFPNDSKYLADRFIDGLSYTKRTGMAILSILDPNNIIDIHRSDSTEITELFCCRFTSLILQCGDQKKVQAAINNARYKGANKNKFWWLINEGMNYKEIDNYVHLNPACVECIEELQAVKVYIELEMANKIFVKEIYNIIVSYLPWYGIVKLTGAQKIFVDKMNETRLLENRVRELEKKIEQLLRVRQ